MKLTKNAEIVLEKRYLRKDKNGKTVETPVQMFKRVAKAVAAADKKYDPNAKLSGTENEFYLAMSEGEFLPNSPTLMNAGTELGQLSACFVLPVEDSLRDIFESLKNMALLQQSGGGTGFNFGRLRQKSASVKTTHGTSSGPVSFIKIFNDATEVIRLGGRRRGANMGILPFDHPDILEFIRAKRKGGELSNFNLSVSVTDKFMEAARKGAKYNLIDPRTKKPCGRLNAGEVFNELSDTAWQCGDPGIIFIDAVNRANPLKKAGALEATNPCGEQPLLPYESCCLGSINLSKLVKKGALNFKRLKELVRLGVHFLDNVIDINKYVLPETEHLTLANRKIGLGVMGFADMLIKMGVPYNSPRAAALAEKTMKFIQEEAHKASQELAVIRGSFPAFKDSAYRTKVKAMRNATVTTIAPTGSVSIIAGCSSGIEPVFAIAYVRILADGSELIECNGHFEETIKRLKLYTPELCKMVLSEGGISAIDRIPEEMKKLFVTSTEISYDWHVAITAAFQRNTDNAVSKTVNLPLSASKEDVKNVFLSAYKSKCKGITVFRQGCKKEQVLSVQPEDTGRISVESEFAGGGPVSYCVH